MPLSDSAVGEIQQDREDGLIPNGEEDIPAGAAKRNLIIDLLYHSGKNKDSNTSQPKGCEFLLKGAPHLVIRTSYLRDNSGLQSIERR